MENFDTLDANTGAKNTGTDLHVTEQSKVYLLEVAKWAKFLSIVGFVGIGLIVIAGLIMAITFSTISGGAGMISFLTYVGMGVLYYFPIRYLYNSSVALKDGINTNDSLTLEDAFENLKSHYKFIGIFTIVILSLYILLFLLAFLGMGAMRSSFLR